MSSSRHSEQVQLKVRVDSLENIKSFREPLLGNAQPTTSCGIVTRQLSGEVPLFATFLTVTCTDVHAHCQPNQRRYVNQSNGYTTIKEVKTSGKSLCGCTLTFVCHHALECCVFLCV
jgi:hypothetical protein